MAINLMIQQRYAQNVVLPAAIRTALSKPMTAAERKFIEEMMRAYDERDEHLPETAKRD